MSLRKNSIYNLIGSIAPLFVTLFTLPIYIGLIGEERFGVLAIAWVLLGYFGLFDLGLGRATAQRIATQKNASDKDRAETFWTAIAINVGFGILGGLLLWPVAHIFFSDYFQVSNQLRPEIIAAVPWLVMALPLATLSGVLSGALQGREQFLTLNIVNVIGNVLFQLIPLSIAFFEPKLTILLPVVVFSRLFTFILLFKYCRKHIPLNGSPVINRKVIKPLFKFGGWITVTSIVGPLMVVFDRFIIGSLLGAKMVTYYTVPYTLAERVSILPASLASALFPRFASVGQREQQRLIKESIKVLAVVLTPITVAGLFLMQPFLRWWLSPEFSRNTLYVGELLLLGVWMNSFARISLAKLQADGRPDVVAKLHVSELLPYMIFMYFAIAHWGVMGAAIAWSARIGVDGLLLFAFSGILSQIISIFIMPFLILSVGTICVFSLEADSTLVAGIVLFCVSVIWSMRNIPPSILKFKN